MIFDAPPAIIHPWPATRMEFYVNNRLASVLSVPHQERMLLQRGDVPVDYRLLPVGLLIQALGFGLPSVLMAGGIRRVWLFTSTDLWVVPGDWNIADNRIHAIGCGGNGGNAVAFTSIGVCQGGGGGGGSAWSWLTNKNLTVGDSHTVHVATTPGDSYFSATDVLLAKGGASASAENGGAGGNAASCVGNLKYSGAPGESRPTSQSPPEVGGWGGSAAGPDGVPIYQGDGFYQPNAGNYGDWDEDVPGLVSGHATTRSNGPSDPSTLYGSGGTGGGVNSGNSAFPGQPGTQGAVLVINNFSL